jgi:hypothetical protein
MTFLASVTTAAKIKTKMATLYLDFAIGPRRQGRAQRSEG